MSPQAIRGGEVRDVPRRKTLMHVAAGVKVTTRGFEVGRLAFSKLVNMEGVLAWRKILDVQGDFNALGRGR
jgi:hypothetical protein